MTVTDRRSGIAEGVAVKAPCRAATTANITLAGEQTIDGIACVALDRVLVKNQTTGSQNGVYNVSTGNWTRALDFDGNNDIVRGTRVFINQGTANGNAEYVVTSADPITIDSSTITFVSVTIALGTGAPIGAPYITTAADAGLSAERVATSSATVSVDLSTPGQALFTVPGATTSAAGVSELATSAEAITGVDTVRTLTPAALAAVIAGLVIPVAWKLYHLRQVVAANTADGALVAGAFTKRSLNTEATAEITGASLASSQITLPAGTYVFDARLPVYLSEPGSGGLDNAVSKLRNVTDSADQIISSATYLLQNADSVNRVTTDHFIRGKFTIAAPKVFELQTKTLRTLIGGQPVNLGVNEIYSEVFIWKTA